MSDEIDNPENHDSLDEESEELEFSIDQLSEAYAKVLKKQNDEDSGDDFDEGGGENSGDDSDDDSDESFSDPIGLEAKGGTAAGASSASESDQADSEDILDDAPSAVSPLTILEAVLFVGAPQKTKLTAKKIAALMRDVSPKEITTLVKELNESYEREGAAYRIVQEDSAYRMELAPEFEAVREKFYGEVRVARLSQPAIDVLSVVAYHQPISREQVDKIRTRKSGSLLSQLQRRQLLDVRTTDTTPPKRHYVTTEKFLKMFGLEGLEDLPQAHEVSSMDELAQ